MGDLSPRPLGGFKILDQVLWSPLADRGKAGSPAVEFCHLLRRKRINIPFLSFEQTGGCARWNIVLGDEGTANPGDLCTKGLLVEEQFPVKGAVLSIFPHRNDPAIAGRLMRAFDDPELWPYALAYSPSALSVLFDARNIQRATEAIFGSFSFSAYHTPADWRLAQQGKEELYKEVIASFQEERPKVYGLKWAANFLLFILKIENRFLGQIGVLLEEAAERKEPLHFLMSSLLDARSQSQLIFCVSPQMEVAWEAALGTRRPPGMHAARQPAALFFMNGPHFGDRYGIISTLLEALHQAGVHLLALNCSVASITGLLPPAEMEGAIEAIKGCFDVPAVLKID